MSHIGCQFFYVTEKDDNPRSFNIIMQKMQTTGPERKKTYFFAA